MAQLLAGESMVMPPLRASPSALGRAIGLVAAACGGALALLWQAGLLPATVPGRAAAGVVVGLGVGYVVRFWLRWHGTALTVTDQRVIVEKGVAGTMASAPVGSVSTVSASRSLIGALLDHGAVRIDLDGGRAIVVTQVPDPHLLVDQLFVLSDNERRGI